MKNAVDILLAQADHEVAEAKAALNGSLIADEIETLVEKVVTRWWLGRMAASAGEDVDPVEAQTSHGQRLQLFAGAQALIQARTGAPTVEALQIGLLSASAELNALWALLTESALVTPAHRQNLLNMGAQDLYERVQEHAKKVVLATGNSARRAS